MAKKKYVFSKKKLRNLYWKQKLSTFKIAKIFDCTAGTIINQMREYGIKRRHSGLKRVNISKKSLYKLYIKKGFSSRKIAKIYHCNQTPILNRLRKYNISIRNPKQKIVISKQKLKQLYIEQKLSTYKIAKIFHCASGTVYRYLKLYRIKTRPLKRVRITKRELKGLYKKKKFALSKIAKFYDCCPAVILDKMKKYGIARRTISETSTRHFKNNFNGNLEEKSYMIGFRLGDLRVRKEGNLIEIGCGTTKPAQIQLIRNLFSSYGPIWITKRDKNGAFHIDCSLNASFKFLLPKHELIPKWILKNKRNLYAFLAGYTDAEGNIGIYDRRARFRIRSYDKKILYQLHNNLRKSGVRSLFGLDQKLHIDKIGISQNKDSWGVVVNEKHSLLKLFQILKPLLKHKKRKRDLTKAQINIISRLKN